jgi:hypothetical protein
MNVVFEKNKFLKHPRFAGNAILIVVGGMICMPLLQVGTIIFLILKPA